ncbi:DEAD/DEAH box helicase [Aneurinibacillus sp. Ricciae_BoGa-3]|uniref:DEAD/DEAH box helicase n=1 Tax=Aneurinibacillus sp. Ricciae_BoGa-3 TaxID=3022697 RepID=UPI002340A7DE|nr:DEAD/DEAH box helicase [Aneurinibacillus sp. Ricciae_BoGa-3]WCK55629.1 DEAD/DEAH box helicase [Aneurinibacillus sp. Ricciae_BoGa-3]
MESFKGFNLKPEVLQGITNLYYKKPTPIQRETIPLILKGQDVIGQAQTGTGKTAAFVIPMLEMIEADKKDIQALVMTPTRELAIQITEDITALSKHMDINVLSLHGGQDIMRQISKLQGSIHIVVGTPGRILDHLRRETLHFGRIKMLVLDEADKMLEMGFLEEVEEVFIQTAQKKQVLLFSATIPDDVRKLAHRFMNQPQIVRLEKKQITAETTKESYYVVNQSDKTDVLVQLIKDSRPYLAVIFANTKTRVNELVRRLQESGIEAEALHGDLSQKKREQIMDRFREAKFQYLVATDIAARGLDVEGITHVFNYDMPSDVESYIHRVGRTGRAGQQGVAISLVSPRQKIIFNRISKAISGGAEEKFLGGAKRDPRARRPREATKDERVSTADVKADYREKRQESGRAQAKKPRVKPGYKKKAAAEREKEQRRNRRKKVGEIYRRKNK